MRAFNLLREALAQGFASIPGEAWLLTLGFFILASIGPAQTSPEPAVLLMVAESASDIHVETAEPDADVLFGSMVACRIYAQAANRQSSASGDLTHVYCLEE